MGRILIGTSSWSDESLLKSGAFYPADARTPAQRLQYYAATFDVTEIDSTFYAFATRHNLELWLTNTPAHFKFNVKAFRLFTQHPTPPASLPRAIRADMGINLPKAGNIYLHHLPAQTVDQLWQGFARTVEVIKEAEKLGTVFFQFPPWYHYRTENLDYIADCKEKLRDYPTAVEFRTGDWLNDEHRESSLQFLRAHGLALVCVDEPQGLASSVPPVAEVTAPVSVVRFHGRNREDWERKGDPETERFRYLYSEAELREWVPKIKAMAKKVEEVHVIFKNKHEDYPGRNALQMKALLGKT